MMACSFVNFTQRCLRCPCRQQPLNPFPPALYHSEASTTAARHAFFTCISLMLGDLLQYSLNAIATASPRLLPRPVTRACLGCRPHMADSHSFVRFLRTNNSSLPRRSGSWTRQWTSTETQRPFRKRHWLEAAFVVHPHKWCQQRHPTSRNADPHLCHIYVAVWISVGLGRAVSLAMLLASPTLSLQHLSTVPLCSMSTCYTVLIAISCRRAMISPL